MEIADAELVARSREGDRDAFGLIVSRYQSLVCAIAYNATGSLTQSEDLAQETFVAAWRQLADIREPGKLRHWLCGIARNLARNHRRRQGREPVEVGQPLEAHPDAATNMPQPAEVVISREEEAILWRSLEKIPETYREPLILFYREQQSVERVAQALDLSEDAVKQRLSRGRKLLHEQVLAFVEGALRQTTPGRAFTFGVLAALPAFTTSAKAATIGVAAAKGSVATATGGPAVILLGALGAFLGPILGLLGAYIGVRASLSNTRTPRERDLVVSSATKTIVLVVIFNISLFALIFWGIRQWRSHPVVIAAAGMVMMVTYAAAITTLAIHFNRKQKQVRREEMERHPDAFAEAETPGRSLPMFRKEYRSRRNLLGLPLIHIRSGSPDGLASKPAMGWIAIGEVAYGIFFAAGGVAVGGISVGGVAIGLLSIGGVGMGLLALCGFAIGGVVIGGGALGFIAVGGFAVAWHAAVGGLAVAHDVALGGLAHAAHANDAMARAYLAAHPWLDLQRPAYRSSLTTMAWLPLLLVALFFWRGKRRKVGH